MHNRTVTKGFINIGVFLTTLFVVIVGLQPVIYAQQEDLSYFLDESINYDPAIPTPKEVLGYELGEWHVRHDQLVEYMYAVAGASNRVTISEYAMTYENRKLLSLIITSPENHTKLEEIKKVHQQLSSASRSGELDLSNMPVVVQMSYSVHGNEPSGANASLAVVYRLAAGQGEEMENMLSNAIILVDPNINPDGLNRFAYWANIHKSTKKLVSDPQSREFDEVWPGGRTNHYWFDLNRDWMLVQHPESQGRIARYQEWKPNVLTDHHEMGTNSTFFFQPGIPSRTHPLTPQSNQDLTSSIAEYHADALDQIQSLYYSKESFDDYYYGKGSTYPDVQGSIGILFEQASSRGHAQESVHGVLHFPFTIRNQVTASFSTLKASVELREELLGHMRQFYSDAAEAASRSSIKAYVFGEEADQARGFHLAEMLHRHEIDVYTLDKSIEVNGERFEAGKNYVVPTNQRQYKLITALFERRTSFQDSLFYDVSAWTMPYAFNLPFAELGDRQFNSNLLGAAFTGAWEPAAKLVGGESGYAYAFEWDEYYTPRAAYRLLEAGIKLKVASAPFSAITDEGVKEFDYGTIMVPLGVQDDQQRVHDVVKEVVSTDGINVYNIATGLSTAGVDLGSNQFEPLGMPRVAVIGGEGTNSYEIGEMWHLLDRRYEMPLTILDKANLGRVNLDRYNVIIMTGYSYGDLSTGTVETVKSWVREGGTLITMKQAVSWASQQGLANVEYVRPDRGDSPETRPYVKQGADNGAEVIGGTIFNAQLDLTHPLAYGYNQSLIRVFRNSTMFLKKGQNPYSTPLYYTDDPLASGYVSEINEETIKGTAAIVVSRAGSGKVIAMTDNPNFRAFWYGTNKLFANAIFFGQTISGSTGN
jgi:hypothetical protein